MSSDVTYHIIGLNCLDLPRELMGTQHGVTWFPAQSNCNKCRTEWNRRVDSREDRVHNDDEGLPEFEDGHIAIPKMKLKVLLFVLLSACPIQSRVGPPVGHRREVCFTPDGGHYVGALRAGDALFWCPEAP